MDRVDWKVIAVLLAFFAAIAFVAVRICDEETLPKTATMEAAPTPAKAEAVVERAVIPCSAAEACPKGFACSTSSHACVPIAKQPIPDKGDPVANDVDKLW